MRKLLKIFIGAVVIIMLGIGEDFSINGILPGISVNVAAAQTIGGGNPSGSGQPIGTTGVVPKTTFTGGTSAVFNSNTVEGFTPVSGISIATIVAATEGDAMQIVGGIFICKNLRCATTNAAGALTVAGGTAWTIAVDDNTTPTALTCAITAAISSCADTTHSFTTATLDLLDYGWTPSGTPTALVPHCSMDCYPQY